MPPRHVSDEQLDSYAMGRLAAEELPSVEEHLLACEGCQSRLRQADEFAVLFREAATLPEARRAAGWRRFWRRPVGIGFATAAMLGVLFIGTRRESPVAAPAIVSMQAMRGPEAPAEIEAGKPALLVFDIDAAKEAQVVDLGGREVLRAPTVQQDGRAALRIDRLSKGSYWVRVYRESGNDPIAEYGLRAR